jgi:N-methylhydantoinase A
LYDELGASIVESDRDGVVVRQAALDLRYVGQEYTLTLQPPGEGGFVAADPIATLDLFTREYERTFGHTLDEPVEVVTVRATVRRPWAHGDQRLRPNDCPNAAREQRTLGAFSFTQGQWVDFAVVHRDTLSPGARLPGPAIVAEETATTYVDSGFELKVHGAGPLVIRGGQD